MTKAGGLPQDSPSEVLYEKKFLEAETQSCDHKLSEVIRARKYRRQTSRKMCCLKGNKIRPMWVKSRIF